jgi:hypothetical protein
MFFSGRDWETSQDRKMNRTNTEVLDKTRALKTSDLGKDSPSNRTTTLSTQPRQYRSGFGTIL